MNQHCFKSKSKELPIVPLRYILIAITLYIYIYQFIIITILILDIDECASTPCLNSGTCTDMINSYTCYCVDGYDRIQCTNGNHFFYSTHDKMIIVGFAMLLLFVIRDYRRKEYAYCVYSKFK